MQLAQLEIALIDIAVSSYRFDYPLSSAGSHFGRLSFNLRMSQIFKLSIVPREIICHLAKQPSAPCYYFNLFVLVG